MPGLPLVLTKYFLNMWKLINSLHFPSTWKEHIHPPIFPSVTIKQLWLSQCAVGFIQICIGWERIKERGIRIWPTLPSVSDCPDLQLKVTALYFLTNISIPVKPLLVSKVSWTLFLPQYLIWSLFGNFPKIRITIAE